MSVNTVNVETLKRMFLAGAARLDAKKEWINELNVFPVPDGDTGTNMTLTIMSAAREVSALENPSMEELCKAISYGSLRGARGNSGVILSQLLRGLTKGIAGAEEIDIQRFTLAFQKSVESAYKAVMKPKEGTILTVAKAGADKAKAISRKTDDINEFFCEVIKYADEMLQKTPDMLPVLKQAGVVDSGGQGLIEVLKGAYDAFCGKEVDFKIAPSGKSAVSRMNASGADADADIKFGYCTEFIVILEKEFNKTKEAGFKAFLESIGDSIVVVADDGMVKVHVHTNDPGLAIQKGLSFGSLTSMKIDNMREEHNERLMMSAQNEQPAKAKEAPAPRKDTAFIAVSIGDGINEIFTGLGIDEIIEGGQTMNPSTEDILEAVEKVNADNVFILPNNKNIILAANQAKLLTKDCNVIVIPTKSVPQGIAAIISYIPEKPATENEERMLEDIAKVKTGQVTYAVRDTNINGTDIHKDDIMAIGDSDVLAVGNDIAQTTVDMIGQMLDEESELISIYYGSDVTEEDADALSELLGEQFSDCDVDIQYGGQPIYYYVISIE